MIRFRLFQESFETVVSIQTLESRLRQQDADIFKEYTSYSDKNVLDKYGENLPYLAEMFETDHTVATLSTKGFTKGEIKRYTIVTWLEGEDIDAQGNPPKGGNLKLGVTINAYENTK